MEHRSTKLFREYIQIPTVQPEPDYQPAVELLVREAESLGLAAITHECVPGKPVLIITWEGMEPSLPSLMLNSHMDVVPVFPEHWPGPCCIAGAALWQGWSLLLCCCSGVVVDQ